MIRLILAISLALIVGLGASSRPASAQIVTFGASAIVINCPTLPGPGESPFDDPDHPCEKAVGVTITVTNSETGEVYGSCETIDAGPDFDHGTCTVIAEIEVPLIITEDVSTLPAGYSAVENPITITLPEGGPPPSAYFINVLQAEPPSEEPPAQAEMANWSIHVINCADDPGSREWGGLLGECEPGPGITVIVENADTGEVLGSCVSAMTDQSPDFATCHVAVPYGTTIVAYEDTSTLPEGYVPREASLTSELPYRDVGELFGTRFANVLQTAPPAGEEPPPPSDAGAPPAQLPSTGAGPALRQLISLFR